MLDIFMRLKPFWNVFGSRCSRLFCLIGAFVTPSIQNEVIPVPDLLGDCAESHFDSVCGSGLRFNASWRCQLAVGDRCWNLSVLWHASSRWHREHVHRLQRPAWLHLSLCWFSVGSEQNWMFCVACKQLRHGFPARAADRVWLWREELRIYLGCTSLDIASALGLARTYFWRGWPCWSLSSWLALHQLCHWWPWDADWQPKRPRWSEAHDHDDR